MNKIIWPGSSSFGPSYYAPTGTSFGWYDLDFQFQNDADRVATYCTRKLGYPMMDVELQDIQLYTIFEEAISVYAEELYHAKIRDNYLTLEGSPTASQLNDTVVVPNMSAIVNLSTQYGEAVGVGGNVEWYTGSLDLIAGVQVYDMQAWASSSGNILQGDKIVIRRIFYEANPAINQYYDPYIGGSINYQGATENFGWASYSPGLNFTLFPIFWDIQRIQEIEMSNYVRRSSATFELINNKLRIFPKPEANGFKLWFQYSKKSEITDPNINNPYSGSYGLVSNGSKVNYGPITYSEINQPGKQWIYEYSLALASELLGLVRGKYTQVPIPGAEVTLNSNDLISKGKEAQQQLRDKLRQDFEDLSRKAQLERKQIETQILNDTLVQFPMMVYIG